MGKKESKSSEELEELFRIYESNMFPSLVAWLSELLGVSEESINRLGVGFDCMKGAWVWAERTELGKIIGLGLRYPDGSKYMVEGSRRGLIYECVQTIEKDRVYANVGFVPARHVDVVCPLCGEAGWCMVSRDDPNNPSAVICGRTKKGSVKYIKNSGYLHRLRDVEGEARSLSSPLPSSDKPRIVVEGMSDVLAAMDKGYVGVGKPSADGGTSYLSALLKNQDVIVVGENDSGVGIRGMQKTSRDLKVACASVKSIMPPAEFKDFRKWCPSKNEFEEWVRLNGEKAEIGKLLFEVDLPELARDVLDTEFSGRKSSNLILYEEDWYVHNGHAYERISKFAVEAKISEHFKGYEVARTVGNDAQVSKLKIDNKFIAEVIGAIKRIVHVERKSGVFEPFYIRSGRGFHAAKTIIFKNGMLDVPTGCMTPLSKDIFFRSAVPYNYNPYARCRLWMSFLDQVFAGDEECIALLQEWFGYNLVASNYLEQMLFLYGVSGSGKSTVGEVLKSVVGEEKYACPKVSDVASGSFGLEQLIGKHTAQIDEEGRLSRVVASKYLTFIKRVTGNDTVSVNRKYKDAVNTKLFCKIVNISNALPVFLDETQALSRRFNVLYFGTSFQDNPDTALKQKLVRERSGIAVWAVQGLQRLLKEGKFTRPRASVPHIEESMDLSSPIRGMLREWCKLGLGPEYFVSRNILYDLYIAICDEEHVKSPVGRRLFMRRLSEAWPECRDYEGWREKERGWYGMQISANAYERYLQK